MRLLLRTWLLPWRGRREAAEVGQRKEADRRADALAYARSILADPIIGSLSSARAIVAETYGAELAAEVVAQLG